MPARSPGLLTGTRSATNALGVEPVAGASTHQTPSVGVWNLPSWMKLKMARVAVARVTSPRSTTAMRVWRERSIVLVSARSMHANGHRLRCLRSVRRWPESKHLVRLRTGCGPCTGPPDRTLHSALRKTIQGRRYLNRTADSLAFPRRHFSPRYLQNRQRGRDCEGTMNRKTEERPGLGSSEGEQNNDGMCGLDLGCGGG